MPLMVGGLALVVVALFFIGAAVRRYEEHQCPPMERFGQLAETTIYGGMAVFALTLLFGFVGGIFFWVLKLVGLELLALPLTIVLAVVVLFRMLRERARRSQTKLQPPPASYEP